MPVTVAVDAMGGDHGPSVTLPAALKFLEETPDARVIAVGQEAPLKAVLARLKSPALDRLTVNAGERSGRHARTSRGCAAEEEGLVDARRDQPRQGRGCAGLRFGREHRRADGDLALRAEDPARHRPSRDRGAAADAPGRRGHGARPWRQRQLLAGAARAVRGHGHGAGRGDGRHRAAHDRAPQCRRGGYQGQRAREADRRAAAGVRSQLPRQRRGQRHLQGDDRRRRLRRLRRQRHAESIGRPRHDALRDAQGRIHAQSAGACDGALRVSRYCARSSAVSIRAGTTAQRSSA